MQISQGASFFNLMQHPGDQCKKDMLKEGLLLYQLNRIEMIEGVEYKDIRIFMLLVWFGYIF